MYPRCHRITLEEYEFPFGTSTMVEFRNRFPSETIAELLAPSVSIKKKDNDDHNDDQETGSGSDHDSTEVPEKTPCHSRGFALLCVVRPMQIPNLGPNCTSAWWTGMPK